MHPSKSDKPDGGRFVRAVDAPSDTEAVSTGELLTRVEEQAKEITTLRMKLASAVKTIKAEREKRDKLTTALKAGKVEAEDLDAARATAKYERSARFDAESSLAQTLDRCDGLELELEHVWDQVEELNEQLAYATRPVWRKLLGRPPRSTAP
jgi:predicted RNase H-like nuclease (RuvC/YqgF family)